MKGHGGHMVTLYIADIALLSSGEAYGKYEKQLDETRLEKVRKCRNEQDKKRSILAGYLIQTGVKEKLYGESGPQADAAPLSLTYIYGEAGKPYLREYPDIFFSLSHSGDYVLCAFSDREIGADIQEHRVSKGEIHDCARISARFFSEKDRQRMVDAVHWGMTEEEMFYRIWSVKEAVMKLDGQGMRRGMEMIGLTFQRPDSGMEENGACFKICDIIKKYSIAVCSDTEITDIRIRGR